MYTVDVCDTNHWLKFEWTVSSFTIVTSSSISLVTPLIRCMPDKVRYKHKHSPDHMLLPWWWGYTETDKHALTSWPEETPPHENKRSFQSSRISLSLSLDHKSTLATNSSTVTLANRKPLLCYIVRYKKHIIRPADMRRVRKPAAYQWALNLTVVNIGTLIKVIITSWGWAVPSSRLR